jgi:hypothetical protein
METKLWKEKMDFIRFKLGFTCMFVVDSVGRNGGLALFWGDNIIVDIQNFSQRHTNGVVKSGGIEVPGNFTSFYGHSDASKRVEA